MPWTRQCRSPRSYLHVLFFKQVRELHQKPLDSLIMWASTRWQHGEAKTPARDFAQAGSR